MQINEMFVRVGADTTGLQRGMRDAENRIRGFGNSVGKVNLDRLRGPLTTVAAQLTGLNPALSTLSSTLLSMAAGGAVTAGAVAGITAIGFAYRKLTEDTRKAREEHEKLVEKINETTRARIAASPQGMQDTIASLRAQLDAAFARRGAAQSDLAAAQMAGPLFPVSNFLASGAARKAEQEVIDLSRELYNASKAFADSWREAQRLDGMLLSVASSADRAKEASEKFWKDFGKRVQRLEAEVMTSNWARNAMVGRVGLPLQGALPLGDLGVRPNAGLGLLPAATGGVGGGRTDNAVKDFADAVGSFRQGVKDMVSDVFGKEGIRSIGANLATQGIGFAAGKIMEQAGRMFTSAAERLAAAMRQNAQALQATAKFLADRLSASGMKDQATEIAAALQRAIDRMRVNTGGVEGLSDVIILIKELQRAGIEFETVKEIAKTLGITLEAINADTLQQLLEQLNRAGAGVDSLADATERAAEALRNVPEIWNAALGRFRATRTAAGNLLAPGATYAFSGNIVLPNVRSGSDFYREVANEATRRTARGGAPVIVDSNQRRRQ